MLKNLFLRPRATIPVLLNEDTKQWLVPLAGYFSVSFAEGYERVVTRFSEMPGIALVAIAAIIALLIGTWMWAIVFGGVLHLSSRLLKGKPGFLATVKAVGYGFFWPGVVAFLSGVVVILGGYRGNDLPAISAIGLLLQVVAGLWAVYTVVAAIKAHHEFGWWKAIAAYLFPFIVIIVGILVVVAVTVMK